MLVGFPTCNVEWWVFDAPLHYGELLEQHRHMALILLAHHAALLTQACSSWWSDQSALNAIKPARSFSMRNTTTNWIETPAGFASLR
jgi:hypothetical protein